MSGSSRLRQRGFSEMEKIIGRATRMAMFITCRVKTRANSRWNGVVAPGTASWDEALPGAGLSGAEMESIVLQYLRPNRAGKRDRAGAHTPWYCRDGRSRRQRRRNWVLRETSKPRRALAAIPRA